LATKFVSALKDGMTIDEALEKYVTGKNRIRRAACLQTLQAISSLTSDQLAEILMWSLEQRY